MFCPPQVFTTFPSGMSVATRDIQPNEEILEAYTDYQLTPNYDRLMQKYMGGNWKDHVKSWN
jgi:hypothetical protein